LSILMTLIDLEP